MKQMLSLLALFAAHAALAQAPKADSQTFAPYLPAQHRLIGVAHGDLNGDGMADVALVSENTDPANILANSGLGSPKLNTNVRRLTILFAGKGAYQRVATDEKLIPSEGSTQTPCLADPFAENGGIAIVRGRLQVKLHYWLSCGSYGVNNDTYSFRHENKRFRLVGFDSRSMMRNSGEEREFSVNFLSGKIKTVTGGNAFESTGSRPRTAWKALTGKRNYYLNAMPDEKDWMRIWGL